MTLSLVCLAATSWGLTRLWPAHPANDVAPDGGSRLVETRRPTLPATVEPAPSSTTAPPVGVPRYNAYASPFSKVAPVSSRELSSWSGWLQISKDIAADAGPALLEFPTLNFRFHRPDRGFLRLDPQTANPAATAAYRNPLTNCEFVVIAEALGIENPTTSADVALAAKRNLSAVAPDVVFEDERERRLHWIGGRMFTASGQARSGRFHSVYWTAASNGYCYQLIYTAPVSTSTPANLEHLLRCFEPIDADLNAHTSAFASPAGYSRDSDLGFSMSLRGTPWRAWPDLDDEYPAAAFGARLDPQTGFLAVPVRLCGLPAEHEALGTALCVLVGRSYVGSAAGEIRRLDDEARNLRIEERLWPGADEQQTFVARTMYDDHHAALLFGWCPTDDAFRLETVRRAFDAAQLKTVRVKTKPDDFRRSTRTTLADFYNQTGLHYFNQSDWARSEQWIRKAVEFAPDNAVMIENLVEILRRRNRASEALALIDKDPRVAGHESLRVKRASLAAEVGRTDYAIAEFQELFALGLRDEDALRRYLELLEQADRRDDAIRAVRTYRGPERTPSLVAIEARYLSRAGKAREAAELLEDVRRTIPGDQTVGFALIDVYLSLDRHADALQLIDELIRGGGDFSTAHYFRGVVLYDQKRFAEAKTAFERAQQLDPSDADVKRMLDLTAFELGQGSDFRIRTPLDAVPLPREVLAAAPTSPPGEEFAAADAYFLDRVVSLRFLPGQDESRTHHHSIRVNNERGVASMNTLRIVFHPVVEEAYVNRLEVFDAQDRPAAKADPASFYVLDDVADGVAGNSKILEMPVPGLRPQYYPNFRCMASAPRRSRCSLLNPRQRVIQPGWPSCFRPR